MGQGLLVEVFHPKPRAAEGNSNWPAWDNRWYVKDLSGYMLEAGASGLALSADTLLRCGTVLAAVRFRGDSWALCPPTTYRKTAKGREDVPTHYSQRVLRNPNLWQTGFMWRHVQGVWMALWGNAYSEIRQGPSSFAGELWPKHPTQCEVADQRPDGGLIYRLREPGQEERTLGYERVLHFRDISTNGHSGLPMYQLIRNVVGIALLAERHATTFLRKGARISGLLTPGTALTKPQRDALKDSVNEDLGGANNTGMLGILPHGVELKQLSQTNKDAQFLELSDAVVGAILRFLNVPGVVVGYSKDLMGYASADAFFEKGGIRQCVLPMLTNVEAEEEKALLLAGEGLQIKHNLDVLQRAAYKDRMEGLYKAVGGPWQTVNEARRIEDLNALDDPRYDEVLTPGNMSPELLSPPAEEPPPGKPMPPRRHDPMMPPEEPEEGRPPAAPAPRARRALGDLALQYAADNATRVVRREIAALAAKAPRFARDTEGWRAFVLEYYGRHAPHVAEVMRIPEAAARAYCDRQASLALAEGLRSLETLEGDAVPRLLEMVLGGEAA